MRDKSKARVSPLNAPPLRAPGQSQRSRASDMLGEGLAPWIACCAFAVVGALLEWYWWAISAPRMPVAYTLICVALLGYFFARKLPRIIQDARQHKLGAEGEQNVAESLDWLRPDGYQVLHDVVENGYNIDHLLIGPSGVYVVETKTRSKYSNHRDVRVTFDGTHVLIDGFRPDRDPVRQVQALCDRVREILGCAGVSPLPPVHPVIAFPGWFVDSSCASAPVWVLNPKQLPGRVRAQQPQLTPTEVRRVADALAQHARTSHEP